MKLFAIALVLSAATAGAQPYLVKDLNVDDPKSSLVSMSPFAVKGTSLLLNIDEALWTSSVAGTTLLRDVEPLRVFGSLGDTLFFAGLDRDHGVELWRTDGTPEGTRLVKDFNRGPDGSLGDGVVFHGALLFTTWDRVVNESALWTSDGTAEGTRFLTHVGAGSDPVIIGDRVLFSSYDGGLWITDGTAAGTRRIGKNFYRAGRPVAAGGRIFFPGTDRDPPYRLWVTDVDGEPAPVANTPTVDGALFPIGNRVVFFGFDAEHGLEPWGSDGMASGTHIAMDIAPDQASSSQYASPVQVDGAVYFIAEPGRGLWRTDGNGASIVKDVLLYSAGLMSGLGRIWFNAPDGEKFGLWTSDGTPAGTRRIADVPVDERLIEGGGEAYFAVRANGRAQLLASDGTAAGTAVIADFSLPPSSNPRNFVPFGKRMLFQTYEKAWTSDGTAAGTRRFPDYFYRGAAFGDSICYAEDFELRRTDGIGSTLVATFPKYIESLVANGPLLFFWAGDDYISDGTAAGTRRADAPPAFATYILGHYVWKDRGGLHDIVVGEPPRLVKSDFVTEPSTPVYDAGGLQLFLRPTVRGIELWRSDGADAGTYAIASFDDAKLGEVAVAADILYFVLDGALWRSDGTAGGTFRFAAPALVRDLTPLDDRVLFTSENERYVRQLWVADAAGARVVEDLGERAAISDLVAANGVVFFAADDGVHGGELWRTDGTAAGTFLVADVEPGPRGSQPRELAANAETLFFSAWTSATGREPWALPLTWQTIAIDSVRVPRSATSATLTVSLRTPATQRVVADWTTADRLARAGVDYRAASGTLVFQPGEMQKRVVVELVPKKRAAGNRPLQVRLRNVRGATPVKSAGTILIDQRR